MKPVTFNMKFELPMDVAARDWFEDCIRRTEKPTPGERPFITETERALLYRICTTPRRFSIYKEDATYAVLRSCVAKGVIQQIADECFDKGLTFVVEPDRGSTPRQREAAFYRKLGESYPYHAECEPEHKLDATAVIAEAEKAFK